MVWLPPTGKLSVCLSNCFCWTNKKRGRPGHTQRQQKKDKEKVKFWGGLSNTLSIDFLLYYTTYFRMYNFNNRLFKIN